MLYHSINIEKLPKPPCNILYVFSDVINGKKGFLAPVVQTLDNAIHRINHYPADSVIDFPIIYPLDSDLSGG